MNELMDIKSQLRNYEQFSPFYRVTNEVGNDLIIRESLYTGSFCDYIADLNDGVVWDLELVNKGLEKIGLKNVSGDIVDLCCGDGRLTKYIYDKGYSTYGIDYSKEQINRAYKKYPMLDWVSANLLDEKEFTAGILKSTVIAAVTSSASVNCFHSKEDLNLFLKNVQKVLGRKGCKYLLLPVFADEAVSIFKENFNGKILCHPFKKNDDQKHVMAWLSLLYDEKKESLIQPILVTANSNKDKIKHEFCYSVDRIWTETDILNITSDLNWKVKFKIPSHVIGGGADQMPFTLLAFEI
ncbi:class I SAM-dependent methyltransferase [Virgibacillus salexigens]|uniref:Methyltransferase domain-containing protein n=1 Tax=Virgibacillus kapii TaxID=1638645 RepID=A0ABQ2E0P8_9BACI|nr:class I SAM-dependent methyltransferase [Virgibacillus kapii]GGJ77754.1 hypothetical protein GCM10007111_44150 [Virgibacillus kapii]